LLARSISPLAVFCAPVLGIWEAVAIATLALVFFGIPLLAVIRRIHRENERLEADRQRPRRIPSNEMKKAEKAPPSDPPNVNTG